MYKEKKELDSRKCFLIISLPQVQPIPDVERKDLKLTPYSPKGKIWK